MNRLFAFPRTRLSISAYGKFENCKAAYILSTHYQVADGLESEALRNGIQVHKEFESVDVIHGFKVLEHEKKVEIDDTATGAWMGYIDAICDDGDGHQFVVDIKTSKRPATLSWARGYLHSLQAALYTVATGIETFAIYHPTDGKLFFTNLNLPTSKLRLRRAFNNFMSWQNAGQQYDCARKWSCRFCEYQGYCEWLIENPDAKLPLTLKKRDNGTRS